MNLKKSILILAMFFFATMQSQTMVTANIQSQLLNKYWCPNVGDPYEVIFFFTQNEVTLFVNNKNIGSEPYYITSNSEVTTPTTFDNSKVGKSSSGNCIKTESSYFIVEFFSDFKSFRWKRSFDPDQVWQIYTLKNGTPYYNTAQQSELLKGNCGKGGAYCSTGYLVDPKNYVGGEDYETTYHVEAGKYISSISQADADGKAKKDVLDNGQNYVNSLADAYCWYFIEGGSLEAQKSNCPDGFIGSKVIYTWEGYLKEPEKSLEQVEKDHKTYAGNYANLNGKCIYGNLYTWKTFYKNDCPSGLFTVRYFDTYRYDVPNYKYTSTISQTDANNKAFEEINEKGQIEANLKLKCEYRTSPIQGTFIKNNCTGGSVGSSYFYKSEDYSTSYISQSDADARALVALNINGQSHANMYGTCTFSSTTKSGSFVKSCSIGGVGSVVVYNVVQGKHTSTISQADADNKAQTDVNTKGQNFANANGTCVYQSQAMNYGFTKNNCPTGSFGSIVYFAVTTGAYTSTISQADADAKARAAGQIYANNKGTCSTQPKPDIR